jgi:hypothetical protein
MTQSEKDAKIATMRDEARELQLRYAFLTLQSEDIATELTTIRTLMRAGEAKFQQLSQQAVDPDA